jgi:hypothetical protein
MDKNTQDKNTQHERPSSAFQVWMGQWRLTTLDAEGCMFVLRFLLHSFRARRPDDRFWSFLERFLFAEDCQKANVDYERRTCSTKDLLVCAGALASDQARALVAYLSECYAADGDRSFWAAVSEAIELYRVAPYEGLSGGTA